MVANKAVTRLTEHSAPSPAHEGGDIGLGDFQFLMRRERVAEVERLTSSALTWFIACVDVHAPSLERRPSK